MSLLRDCEFLNASIKQGRQVVDRCRDYRQSKITNAAHPCGLDLDKKHERCPTCGGMVILPCLACSLERWSLV